MSLPYFFRDRNPLGEPILYVAIYRGRDKLQLSAMDVWLFDEFDVPHRRTYGKGDWLRHLRHDGVHVSER